MTRFIRRRGKQKNETGFTLVAAVILVVLIGLLGVVSSFLFVSGTTTTKDYLLSARAFSAAEGGLERGIRQYFEDGSFSGETNNLTLGGQSYPFTTTVLSTDFSGAALPANQRRIQSSGTFQSVQRVVGRIVQRDSILSQYALSSQGNIIRGGTTYTSCPGGAGCPANSITNQYLLPITVAGGSNRTNPPLVRGNTYNYNTVTINSNLTMTGSGSAGVTIYCTQLTVSNNRSINGGAGNPDNLLIVVQGNVSIGNTCTFKGAIYAPNGSITIGTSFSLTGAIAGNSLSIGTSSNITFDNGAGSITPDQTNGYNQTPIVSRVANGWQEAF